VSIDSRNAPNAATGCEGRVANEEEEQMAGEGGCEFVACRRGLSAVELSGAVAAEHPAMEDAPDEAAADAALGYLMEFAPQAFAAHQVQWGIAGVMGQIRPCYAPHAFRDAATHAGIDYAIGTAGVGEFD
jgi:hypothetical protein